MNVEGSLSTRASLIEAIKNADNHESWCDFAQLYGDLIRRLALAASLTEDEAKEVVQDVLISVAKNIGNFTYDPQVSSFKNWLSRMVRWRIAGQQRNRWRQRLLVSGPTDDDSSTGLLERIPSPALPVYELLDRNWAEQMFRTALERVKCRVDPKHYQIYFLRVLKDRSVAEVCQQLKVNRGQIDLAKFRMERLLEKELSRMARELDGRKIIPTGAS
jgi:RNA polymerase sigma factor (sigma-70 family)